MIEIEKEGQAHLMKKIIEKIMADMILAMIHLETENMIPETMIEITTEEKMMTILTKEGPLETEMIPQDTKIRIIDQMIINQIMEGIEKENRETEDIITTIDIRIMITMEEFKLGGKYEKKQNFMPRDKLNTFVRSKSPEISGNVPEEYLKDYPYCKYHKSESDKLTAFSLIQEIVIKLTEVREPYVITSIPQLPEEFKKYKGKKIIYQSDSENYWKCAYLSDLYNEQCRVKGKRFDEEFSALELWEKYKVKILKNIIAKKLDLSPKGISDYIFENCISGCTTFKPYLLSTFAKKYNFHAALDIASGWGDRLLGALASRCDYLGVDPNSELFQGYREMIQDFGNAELVSTEPLHFKNYWNSFKILCAPFEKCDLGTYTCDFIFSCPPYFDLEVYSEDPNQSIKQYPTLSSWEENFFYASLSKAWSRLRPQGYLVIILNNLKNRPDYTYKAVLWANKNLNDNIFHGLLPYGAPKHFRTPQPMWVWQKTSKTPINELYYIGNEVPELIVAESEEELKKLIGQNDLEIKDGNIFIGKDGEQTMDYGTITLANKKYRVMKKFELKLEMLNPEIKTEKITVKGQELNLICENKLLAGTLQRAIDFSKVVEDEIVLASSINGHDQIAVALAAKLWNKKLKIFSQKADSRSSLRAQQLGATIDLNPEIEHEELINLAKSYAEKNKAHFLPSYLRDPLYQEVLGKSLTISLGGILNFSNFEGNMWLGIDSDILLKTLLALLPKAKFMCVILDPKHEMELNERITYFKAPEEFEEAARILPSYESNLRRDAKIFRFISQEAKDGDYIWNSSR